MQRFEVLETLRVEITKQLKCFLKVQFSHFRRQTGQVTNVSIELDAVY